MSIGHILPCNNLIRTTDFFWRFLVSRKYKIQIVAHVGRKSVVELSGVMEASYRHFFIGQGFNCSRGRFQCSVEKLQKLPLASLQAPREQKNRTLLEKLYTFDEAIPPEDEVSTTSRTAIDDMQSVKTSRLYRLVRINYSKQDRLTRLSVLSQESRRNR